MLGSRSPLVGAALAWAALAVAGCGRTPLTFPAADDDADTSDDAVPDLPDDPTTDDGPATTDDGPATTDDGPATTDDGTVDPPTCREALQCILGCLTSGQLDLECPTACVADLPPEEGEKALALGQCAVTRCIEGGECSFEDLQSESCITCIGFGLIAPSPSGCEEEAEACE